MTPATYAVVNFLKRSEGVDYFDRGTNFNPFATETTNSDRPEVEGA
jgi:queuosine precursor transporter